MGWVSTQRSTPPGRVETHSSTMFSSPRAASAKARPSCSAYVWVVSATLSPANALIAVPSDEHLTSRSHPGYAYKHSVQDAGAEQTAPDGRLPIGEGERRVRPGERAHPGDLTPGGSFSA